MEYTHVILVDEADNILGEMEKLEAHEKGLLHRAFSIMLYRKTSTGIELLLQKRAENKYHCSGQWSNTCCSHPQKDMSMQECLESRLSFEMGIEYQNLNFAQTFQYHEICKGGLIEHELDHVYVGEFVPTNISPNANEVCEYDWVNIAELEESIQKTPQNYTPWLQNVIKITKDYLQSQEQAA